MKYLVSIVFLFGFLTFGYFNFVQTTNFSDVVINEIAWPVKAAYAANGLKMGIVVINEVAWMGTLSSYNNEWIELKNNTGSEISLDGWILRAADGTPEINLTAVIPPNGFYLLERTDDNTVPGVLMDQKYTGALGNNGEKLELHDNLGNLIDSVDASSSWPAGDNATKQTMEKTNSGWQTSAEPGGTPKAKNSVMVQVEPSEVQPPRTETPEESLTENRSPEAEKPVVDAVVDDSRQRTYLSGIVINEILPSPEGPDEKEEWIELFNQNGFDINISNWQIKDVVGSINIYIFPEGTTIKARGFLVLYRPNTKIILNNEGDSLKLVLPDGNMADVVNYENAPLNKSYNRNNEDWLWSDVLTPGSTNVINPRDENRAPAETEKQEILSSGLPEKTPGLPKFAIVLLEAFGISILGGTTVLFIKKRTRI